MNRWNFGGRLAVKAAVGKYDLTDAKPELGDHFMDVDLAAIGATMPEKEGFAFNGQIGFRYRMQHTEKLTVNTGVGGGITVDTKITPGMMIYTQLEPGFSAGTDKAFQIRPDSL